MVVCIFHTIFNFSNLPYIDNMISPFFSNILFLFDNAARISCLIDDDCPIPDLPVVMKCIDNLCRFDLVGISPLLPLHL
jgi:hypothetical protein